MTANLPKTITFIVDNGHSYSDHTIYFIEVPVEHAEGFKVALGAQDTYHPETVQGQADRIEWREGASEPDLDHFHPNRFLDDDEPRPAWTTIPKSYRARLIEHWRKPDVLRSVRGSWQPLVDKLEAFHE